MEDESGIGGEQCGHDIDDIEEEWLNKTVDKVISDAGRQIAQRFAAK